MTENPKTFSRPLRIEVFLEPDTNKKNNNSRQNESIAKNQQEFGHKKELNPDVRELKANNKLHPKALKKDSENR